MGRKGSPTGGWKTAEAHYPELFADAAELEATWYYRTGIYPMHSTIVVKDSLLAQNPWVAKSLFDAFSRAKNAWLARLAAGTPDHASDQKYAALSKVVGRDPLLYGFEANIKTIEALEDTAFKQKLTPRRMSVAELFVDPNNS